MPAIDTARGHISLSRLSLKDGWSGYVVPVSGFPVPEAELKAVREFVRNIVAVIAKKNAGALATFVHLTQLHLGDGAQRVSANGRDWMPAMGLGVWPDREPPHSWTTKELQALVPGEKLRPMMDIALHLTNAAKGDAARDTMLGLGTIFQFFIPAGSEKFLAAARALLWPGIKDPSFTSFPFYVPLLEAKSIANATPSQLESWMCGAQACIRESPEDKGILILAMGNLEETLVQAGAERPGKQTDEWRIPL